MELNSSFCKLVRVKIFRLLKIKLKKKSAISVSTNMSFYNLKVERNLIKTFSIPILFEEFHWHYLFTKWGNKKRSRNHFDNYKDRKQNNELKSGKLEFKQFSIFSF